MKVTLSVPGSERVRRIQGCVCQRAAVPPLPDVPVSPDKSMEQMSAYSLESKPPRCSSQSLPNLALTPLL